MMTKRTKQLHPMKLVATASMVGYELLSSTAMWKSIKACVFRIAIN